MSTRHLAQIITLLNAGKLLPDQFPRALKWLNKLELQTLFDMLAGGQTGSPRERLSAIARKEHAAQFLAKLSKLPVTEQGEVWLRLQGGEAVDL